MCVAYCSLPLSRLCRTFFLLSYTKGLLRLVISGQGNVAHEEATDQAQRGERAHDDPDDLQRAGVHLAEKRLVCISVWYGLDRLGKA